MSEDPGAARTAAGKALREWARNNGRRDDLVRAAVAAGLSASTIQEITGIARTTVRRIAGPVPRYRRPARARRD